MEEWGKYSSSLGHLSEDYSNIRRLGEGGFGLVVQGYHKIQEEWHAIKIIDMRGTSEEERKLLHREIKLHKQCKHKYVIKMIHAFMRENWTYLIMPVCETDLHKLLFMGKCSQEELLRIIMEVCEGVEYLHGRGILHRDIKPPNILIREKKGEQITQIADFGLAKHIKGTGLTSAKFGICGTVEYMAPELLMPLKPDDRISLPADSWAIGVIIYQCLEGGKYPFLPDMLGLIMTFQYQKLTPLNESWDPFFKSIFCSADKRLDAMSIRRVLEGIVCPKVLPLIGTTNTEKASPLSPSEPPNIQTLELEFKEMGLQGRKSVVETVAKTPKKSQAAPEEMKYITPTKPQSGPTVAKTPKKSQAAPEEMKYITPTKPQTGPTEYSSPEKVPYPPKYILCGGFEKKLKVIEFSSWKIEKEIEMDGYIYSMLMIRDNTVIVGLSNGNLIIVKIKEGGDIEKVEIKGEGSVFEMCSIGENIGVASGESCKVDIYDINTIHKTISLEHPNITTSISVIGTEHLVTGCEDGYARIWNLRTFNLSEKREIAGGTGIVQVVGLSDERIAISAYELPHIWIWNWKGDGGVKCIKNAGIDAQLGSRTKNKAASISEIRPGLLAFGVKDNYGMIRVWNLGKDKEEGAFKANQRRIAVIRKYGKDKFMAGTYGNIVVFDLSNWATLQVIDTQGQAWDFAYGHSHLLCEDWEESGWECGGKFVYPNGCFSGITGYNQTKGKRGWRCEECDFEICDQCADNSKATHKKFGGHPHTLTENLEESGWECAGKNVFHEGCASGITGFHQTKGLRGWRCEECDFEVCDKCVFKTPPSKTTFISPVSAKGDTHEAASIATRKFKGHDHLLYESGSQFPWACDGRSVFPDGCESGIKGSPECEGKRRWRCEQCDYDLCDICIKKPLPVSKTSKLHKHSLFVSPKLGWICQGTELFLKGCESGITDKKESLFHRHWRCEKCDFDLCDICVEKVPTPTKNHGSHPHPLFETHFNGWYCDGMNIYQNGCASGTTNQRLAHGITGWRCQRCNFDLCDKCVNRSYVKPTPTPGIQGLDISDLLLFSLLNRGGGLT